MDSQTDFREIPLQVDFSQLAQALIARGILDKSLSGMTKEEITDLCKIIIWSTVDDVPF